MTDTESENERTPASVPESEPEPDSGSGPGPESQSGPKSASGSGPETSLSRPRWPAYLLSAFVAGFGHWYLGQWKRGASWFGLYVLALAFLSARTLSGAFDLSEPFVITALQFDAVNYADVAVPLAVLIICLLDLYLLGLANRPDPSDDVNGVPK
ncbi:hypothetical protein C482_07024 [Natrialba chahannaoensis JCM 10990]|uniref:Uncharacterized protein n=1 Tax=Natrialba chahannaoensis JCM 10990 TaxID=1227492 RepID=M0AT75_9EURY|nr:hypothetical protein C482_07024 [Natrialba chahannaoensis JCM 10990]